MTLVDTNALLDVATDGDAISLRAAIGLCSHKKNNRQSAGETPMSGQRSTMRKVYWRLLPLTILVYFLCYLDRINVGFAALTMNKDLGLDAATYGMAAGAFFWAISCLRSRATSS